MKKKKLLLMLLLAPFAMAFAQIEDNAETENNDDRLLIQPIAFAYDAAGNRISRTIVSNAVRDSISGVIVWNAGELGGKTVMITPRPSQGELTVVYIVEPWQT